MFWDIKIIVKYIHLDYNTKPEAKGIFTYSLFCFDEEGVNDI